MTTKDNLIKLPLEKRRLSAKERKLMAVSDEIDAVILKHIEQGDIDLKTLAGLLAHRLGSFLSKVDRKQELWELCAKVAKDQAKVS